MRKIVSVICILALCLSLFGCGESDYPPVESTAREAEVLFSFRAGGETYRVRYELYRTFYLTYRSEYPELMSDEDERALEDRVLSRILAIYATLALCDEYGVDPYSEKMDEKIEDFIRVSVEGGSIDSNAITGYGSYEEYLESLRSLFLNYEVQTLIFRYHLALSAIAARYPEVDGLPSDLTHEEVRAFYNGEQTRRYLSLYLPANSFTETRAKEIRDTIASLNSEDAVVSKMIRYSSLAVEEMLAGTIITPYNLDAMLYGDLTKTATSLSVGETSEPITVYNNQNQGYFILWAAEKSDAHFTDNYEKIARECINDTIGRDLDAITRELAESIRYTDAYETLDRATISMND